MKAGEGSSYAPSVRGKASGGQGMRGFETDIMVRPSAISWEASSPMNIAQQPPSPPPLAPKPKGKRAMDHFLEEIKRYATKAVRVGYNGSTS